MSYWLSWTFEWPRAGFDLSCPPAILAYLDPGMGSYALQILLASFFGGMFALKQSWAGIREWIAIRSSHGDRPQEITRPRIDGQSSL